MIKKIISAIFSSLLFSGSLFSDSLTIQTCEDISLFNKAYANNKLPANLRKHTYDTLMLSNWAC